ncbi:transposase [Rhizobium rosettiformans]|uniref:Transposase n=1 Tax=Rhizobium rosettiformans TaxID=1368430 RepID=A0ABX7ETM6_9HYPH|nr:transposase domain-containing protein [Rhizobium rosettiformans]QRF51674.1 transposase [Rhizobium rosettiformans]
MKEWFTLSDLAEAKLPDMPWTIKGYDKYIIRHGWRAIGKVRKRQGREGGGGFEYHISLLPDPARQKLAFLHSAPVGGDGDRSALLWRKYEALTETQKTVCKERLAIICSVEDMKKSGIRALDAIKHVSRKADISISTYYQWQSLVEGHARQDWLAALAPSSSKIADGVVADLAPVHPDAWDMLVSDYLRPEGPAFAACYRRMEDVAKRKGWAPIPHERTLRRRIDIQIPKAVQELARKGKEASKRLIPALQRSVAHLHAMQMVNTDGHKLDLHVSFPGREKWGRVYLMAIQDIYSRKILSWVLCEAETWEAVRTAIGNMVETHGIPDRIYMDNGRAFASKMISGKAKRRNRFKITEDEVAGLLKTLGIDARFVNPYSGQSKPIERGWGDLAENIAKHPAMAGCYTGRSTQHKPENYGSRAVPIDELERHVAMCVEEHNARTGRKTETAKGRSFDAVFAESVANPANTYVRFASPSQRALWMLAAVNVTARKPDGAIHLFDNRYFHPALNNWIGKKLKVLFDPSDLHGAVKVYAPDGRLLCDAECVDKTGFDCADAAREIARARATKKKDQQAALNSARKLSDLELKELTGRSGSRKPAKPKPAAPVVTRLITRTPVATKVVEVPEVTVDEHQYEDAFSRGLARVAGGDAAIIEFPRGDRPTSGAFGRRPRTEK